MPRNGNTARTVTDKVNQNTADHINDRIAEETKMRLAYFAQHAEDIDRRLQALDREQDIEQVLETNAATISIIGLTLGLTVNRKWFALPLFVSGFLFQHARQGWCPPLPFFRRIGIRTSEEIGRERYALKYLRGDFDVKPGNGTVKNRVQKILSTLDK